VVGTGEREDARTGGRKTLDDADVLVFDGFTPREPPSRPALLFRPDAAPWLSVGEVVTAPALTTRTGAHPVMRAVTFDDLHVVRAVPILATSATPLVVASNAVLAAAGTAAAPWVAVGFGLEDSTLASQPAFPIFVANVLAWFEGERLALARRPGTIEVPWPSARIVDASGRDVASRSSPGGTLFESSEPGLFYAIHDGVRSPVAVNLADPAASDVGRTRLPARVSQDDTTGTSRLPVWTWLALAAWALLVLEWWTWQRRITI
jgi:hypothetical protein